MSRARLIFFGTPEFAEIHLRALVGISGLEIAAVVTQPDRPSGRGQKLQFSAVKKAALEFNLPIFQPDRLKKNHEFLNQIQALGPIEIGVVVAFGQILPIQVLQIPKYGFINVHASILPRWRGAAPIQRAIMAGDRASGVCLMKMEEGLDSGPVFSRFETPIEPTDDFGQLHDRLAKLGAELLCKDLFSIVSGQLAAKPQDADLATYAAKIESAETKIDWRKTAVEIRNLIFGLSPVPGAFSHLGKQRLKIFKAEVKTALNDKIAPAQIAFCDRHRLEVQTGSGVVSLLEVQPEGKRRMPIEEYLKGNKISAGESFE